MFAGEPLCAELIGHGRHYVFQIKADQKHFLEKMELVFAGRLQCKVDQAHTRRLQWIVRAHWGMGNQLHHPKDRTWLEERVVDLRDFPDIRRLAQLEETIAADDDPGDPGQFVDIVQQFVFFEEKVQKPFGAEKIIFPKPSFLDVSGKSKFQISKKLSK